jgi:hypothetical protein
VLELVDGLVGLVELGLVLDDEGLVLDEDGLVLELALLELDELPWNEDDPLPWPPWLLGVSNCHGTGHSLLSAEITANSTRPLVGFSTTSSILPTSSPELVFTCAPMTLVLRKYCDCPAAPVPRPVGLSVLSLDWLLWLDVDDLLDGLD